MSQMLLTFAKFGKVKMILTNFGVVVRYTSEVAQGESKMCNIVRQLTEPRHNTSSLCVFDSHFESMEVMENGRNYWNIAFVMSQSGNPTCHPEPWRSKKSKHWKYFKTEANRGDYIRSCYFSTWWLQDLSKKSLEGINQWCTFRFIANFAHSPWSEIQVFCGLWIMMFPVVKSLVLWRCGTKKESFGEDYGWLIVLCLSISTRASMV